MISRPTLHVLLLSDGKPGHFMLAEAIVAALARLRRVSVERVEVRRPRLLPPRALSALTNAGAPGLARLLGLDLGIPSRTSPGLIVSAGGDTLAANVIAARHFGAPNVFYGSLRRYRADDFTLVLTSYAEQADAPGRENTVMTLKPSARDPAMLPPPAAIGEPISIGLLVGGDSGTIRFQDSDWQKLLALASGLQHRVKALTIANSRRTPGRVSDQLAALALAGGAGTATGTASGTCSFIDVRAEGAGTLGPLFAASDAILATVDSSSMISEAVWAQRRAVVLTPARWRLPPLEQTYRRHMEHHGWTVTLPLHDATPTGMMAAIGTVSPLATNPLDDLAKLLGQRLGLA